MMQDVFLAQSPVPEVYKNIFSGCRAFLYFAGISNSLQFFAIVNLYTSPFDSKNVSVMQVAYDA